MPDVPDSMAALCMTPVGRVLDQVAGLPGLDGTRASGGCAWRTDPDGARPGVFGPENLPRGLNASNPQAVAAMRDAIAFLPSSGVSARTILTYGQSEDPTSPWSADQTQLFSDE